MIPLQANGISISKMEQTLRAKNPSLNLQFLISQQEIQDIFTHMINDGHAYDEDILQQLVIQATMNGQPLTMNSLLQTIKKAESILINEWNQCEQKIESLRNNLNYLYKSKNNSGQNFLYILKDNESSSSSLNHIRSLTLTMKLINSIQQEQIISMNSSLDTTVKANVQDLLQQCKIEAVYEGKILAEQTVDIILVPIKEKDLWMFQPLKFNIQNQSYQLILKFQLEVSNTTQAVSCYEQEISYLKNDKQEINEKLIELMRPFNPIEVQQLSQRMRTTNNELDYYQQQPAYNLKAQLPTEQFATDENQSAILFMEEKPTQQIQMDSKLQGYGAKIIDDNQQNNDVDEIILKLFQVLVVGSFIFGLEKSAILDVTVAFYYLIPIYQDKNITTKIVKRCIGGVILSISLDIAWLWLRGGIITQSMRNKDEGAQGFHRIFTLIGVIILLLVKIVIVSLLSLTKLGNIPKNLETQESNS